MIDKKDLKGGEIVIYNKDKNIIDLDNTVEENIKLISEAKKLKPENLTACVLKRSRHDNITTIPLYSLSNGITH